MSCTAMRNGSSRNLSYLREHLFRHHTGKYFTFRNWTVFFLPKINHLFSEKMESNEHGSLLIYLYSITGLLKRSSFERGVSNLLIRYLTRVLVWEGGSFIIIQLLCSNFQRKVSLNMKCTLCFCKARSVYIMLTKYYCKNVRRDFTASWLGTQLARSTFKIGAWLLNSMCTGEQSFHNKISWSFLKGGRRHLFQSWWSQLVTNKIVSYENQKKLWTYCLLRNRTYE